MTEILPLRAWRYNEELSKDIASLVSPTPDVVSRKQVASLYQNPLNSIYLSVPHPPLAAERAALTLEDWKKQGIIRQDNIPAIYVYYQYFRLPDSTDEHCRKGFISHARLYPWEEKVILRHENVQETLSDRIEILEKTELNVNPTMGLYTDASLELEKYMDEAISVPLYEASDYQGVRNVLSVIHDAKVIQYFIHKIKNQKIMLADGHHDYEVSLANMHHQKRVNPHHNGKEGYNFHIMYLTNTESLDPGILPPISTYLYPKVICGFLFGSIKEDEFRPPVYAPFVN